MRVTRSRLVKVLVGLVVAGILVAGLTASVALPSVRDLKAARAVLGGSAADLGEADVERADRYLARVVDRLEGLPARVLGVVPVVGPSLGAMRAVATAARPVLAAGLALKEGLDDVRETGIVDRGRVRVERLAALRAPLQTEVDALAALEDSATVKRNGWVAPPVWDALDDIAGRTGELLRSARRFDALLEVLDDLLGNNGPRTYLVMLLNNAELRGAGGALTGAGTITLRDGRLVLGRFWDNETLRTDPYIPVPAPGDYTRRYGVWGSNTTLFINATYSPDVPDDALVAARLLEKVRGIETDGAFVVDPRGLAALLPPDHRVSVPGVEGGIGPEELPRFVYSDAYELFDSNVQRRAAILELGANTFREIVRSGSSDAATTDAAGDAFAGGHLRFVSFDEDEQAVLDELGVGGNIKAEDDGDRWRVAAQNWGGGIPRHGSKLDYWVRRELRHECAVEVDGSARCVNHVTFENEAPDGLITYVAGKPYAMVRNNVESYLPPNATIEVVERDGKPVDFDLDEMEGHRIVEVYLSVPQGRARTITIQYALPSRDDGYVFRAYPQPLARDATIDIALALPRDWKVDGPGEDSRGVWRYRGDFVSTVELRATPDQRTGIPGLWDSLSDFWTQPVSD
ncbi:MAG TPA: DUF4012 domain-containing protein [Actinomycetota bacterium]